VVWRHVIAESLVIIVRQVTPSVGFLIVASFREHLS
jgi:hypothetical protein